MSYLYNNKEQESKFHLLEPRKLSQSECQTIKSYFHDFLCDKSFVIAEQSPHFNCIGWAIGVKAFLDPSLEVNPYYSSKNDLGNGLWSYTKDQNDCKQAVSKFFDSFKERSLLPNKNNYVATKSIPIDKVQDDTIAFYFIEGQEKSHSPDQIKGFSHAARYVKDLNSWVSDIWTSKLGPYKLVTHSVDELSHSVYGDVLCYLVPDELPNIHNEL